MRFEPKQTIHGESNPEDYVLPIGTIFRIVWKRLWVVVLLSVMFAGVAVGLSLQQTPMYETSVKILIGQDRGIVETPQDALALQTLTLTMAEAVNSSPTAEAVVEELGLQLTPEQVLAGVSAEEIPDTQFIQVSYTDTDPERAQLVANTIGVAFSERISNIGPDANLVTATVWEQALLPETPVSPNPLRNGILAFLLGGMLGVGLAFLLEYLDDRWSSPEEAEQVSGAPNLGVIPEIEPPKKKKGKGGG